VTIFSQVIPKKTILNIAFFAKNSFPYFLVLQACGIHKKYLLLISPEDKFPQKLQNVVLISP